MKKMLLSSLAVFTFFPSLTYALSSVGGSVSYFIGEQGNPNYEEALSVDFLLAFNSNVQINVPVNVTGTLIRSGQGESSPYHLIGRQLCVNCANHVTLAQTTLVKENPTTMAVPYPVNTSFTVSAPGTYFLQVGAGVWPPFAGPIHTVSNYEGIVSFTVLAAAPQCSDGINNNDGDNLVDQADPQCHTDCNVSNVGSYAPNHTSESSPPNGTCPAPASLQINGRAAFFQVVKNFFASITVRAFAGE